MFSRKRFLSLIASTAALSLLSLSAVAAQDPVVIDWWHIQTVAEQGAYWDQVIADYEAANPGVDIQTTVLENEAFKSRLVTVMQAGDPPDLFQSWGGGVLWAYADAGLVRDISPELEGEWRDTFEATSALELFGQDGAYYGVPWNWGAVGMWYNKALFEQAGLDPENPPQTWDEFVAAVQTLKDAGITPIALGEADKFTGHFWWVYLALRLGGEEAFLNAYNREGSFADEPFVQAGEYLAQLRDMGAFPEGFLGMSYGQQAGLVGDGLAAMELMGQWAPGVQAGNSEQGGIGEDLGFFPFPTIEGAPGNEDVLGGGDGFAVGINAPDETIAFLQYITSEEVQRGAAEIFVVPTVKNASDVLAESQPLMLDVIDMRNNANYFQLYYDQFLPPALGSGVNDSVELLLAEVASPEEVAQAIEDLAVTELATE